MNFYDLAVKHISGQASEEESARLFARMEEHPEEREAFDELRKAWEAYEGFEQESHAEEDWQKLESRLQTAPRQGFLGRWRQWSVAASVILVAGISIGIWWNEYRWLDAEATGANLELELPDHSKVILKKGSRIRYKRNFEAHRDLELDGEAYFTVVRDPAHPFRVESEGTRTTVLGTAFDIRQGINGTSTEIRVTEGKVSFEGDNGASLILKKGMAAVYDRKSRELKTLEFGTENTVSWFMQRLRFDNTPIHIVMEDIAHYYGVRIEHRLPANYCPLTGEYGSTGEQELVQILREVLELEIVVKEDTWIVTKGTCRPRN